VLKWLARQADSRIAIWTASILLVNRGLGFESPRRLCLGRTVIRLLTCPNLGGGRAFSIDVGVGVRIDGELRVAQPLGDHRHVNADGQGQLALVWRRSWSRMTLYAGCI